MRLGRGTFGEIHAELDNFEVNTQARRLDNANWAWKFQSQGGRLIMTRHTGWIESAPGLLKARIRWSVTGSFGSNASAPLNCEWTVEETLQSEIVETGVPLVELVFDPAVEEQLKHGMSATVIQTQQDCDVRITFDGNSLTTAVVGDLLLLERLSDGEYGPPREWTFGQYILERNTQTEPRIKEFSWGGMTVDTAVVDVVIRPAPTFACWETLYNSIWGKQITIPGVRVIRKPEGQSNESDGEPDGSKPMPAKD